MDSLFGLERSMMSESEMESNIERTQSLRSRLPNGESVEAVISVQSSKCCNGETKTESWASRRWGGTNGLVIPEEFPNITWAEH